MVHQDGKNLERARKKEKKTGQIEKELTENFPLNTADDLLVFSIFQDNSLQLI